MVLVRMTTWFSHFDVWERRFAVPTWPRALAGPGGSRQAALTLQAVCQHCQVLIRRSNYLLTKDVAKNLNCKQSDVMHSVSLIISSAPGVIGLKISVVAYLYQRGALSSELAVLCGQKFHCFHQNAWNESLGRNTGRAALMTLWRLCEMNEVLAEECFPLTCCLQDVRHPSSLFFPPLADSSSSPADKPSRSSFAGRSLARCSGKVWSPLPVYCPWNWSRSCLWWSPT